jgi:hypothetical protein
MLLPNSARAVVDPPKVRDYLLSREHGVGGSKAVVFESVGYRRESWEVLRGDLLALASSSDAFFAGLAPHGRKFLLLATLIGPSGRALAVITVWIIRWNEDFPRFVAAYPGGRR